MRIFLLRVGLLVTILLAWQLASGPVIPTFFISKPSAIFTVLAQWVKDGSLFFHAAITATEAFAGFLLGAFAGIAVGLVLGRAKIVADVVHPFINAFYSLPKLALAPLFILWFGIGMDMKIVLVATIVFFLVFLNTYTGVRNVSPEQITIMRLMGAREHHLLTKVVIPSAIAWVFAGLRISVPYSLVGAVVGELVAANRGLGYLLAHSAGQFDTAGVFAALVSVVVLAGILNACVCYLAARAMPWRSNEGDREAFV